GICGVNPRGSALLRQPLLQVGEGILRRGAVLGRAEAAALPGGRVQLLLVLVVVAIDAEQLPVAAVGGIVGVVVVPMVDGELAQVGAGELAGAAPADPRVELERALPVARLAHRQAATAALREGTGA